jgi:DNA-binding protein YbaB
MSNPTLDYFEEYRKKKEELKEIDSKISELRKQADALRTRSSSIKADLEGMKKIITVMVETGMEPVEVKLKHELSELQQSFWDDVILEADNHTTITLSPATTVTWPSMAGGAASITHQPSIMTGAIGATGATSHPYQTSMRITGSNGIV